MLYKKQVIINYQKGLHVRVAAMLVQRANELKNKFNVELFLSDEMNRNVPATTIMAVTSLNIRYKDKVTVLGKGNNAVKAVNELAAFIEGNFEVKTNTNLEEVDDIIQETSLTSAKVFEKIANGLIVVDKNNVITVFNKSAERIMGIKAFEVIGRKADEVIPGSRLHIVMEKGEQELGYRQTIGRATIITNRTPIIVNGNVIGAVAVFQDISEIEQLAGELNEVKELKEKLHLILKSVTDGVCAVDKDGNITYVNPAYEAMVKKSKAELEKENVFKFFPESAIARALKEKKTIRGFVSERNDGTTFIANAAPIYVDGQIQGAVSVSKEVNEVEELIEKLSKATAKAQYLEEELKRVQKLDKAFDSIIGKSGKLRDALTIAAKSAETCSTVLIRGESGTGKELLAKSIHFASPRKKGPFIRVNCAAIPTTLLESELFGYEKGAFTGAVNQKIGKFELAHGGTIFLDEIGDMEKDMQAKLLRVLQEREIERVGGTQTIKIDVRIIAATNKNLEEMVKKGDFREDLYYRLNVIPINLPSLREKKEDIPLLAEYFLKKLNTRLKKNIRYITRKALICFLNYHWPGNVRELENIIERAINLSDDEIIDVDDLPSYISGEVTEGNRHLVSADLNGEIAPFEEYEKQIIKMALEKYGSFNAAGKALGITHKTVAFKARKYGIV
ncbi:phosphotransferase system HPr (HPr) family protein [Desulfohalotomaculum tongense]|uniref:sigma 54-interacting transcriptional regulator n=1 Tax=Desulforadius tongensis TaxID=1216062 RepID=UPI00195DF991|nr:sigma 54-interacting transcriptional regulator [Desulforadius tongensis]MBM7854813.1 phosphotransferase system HPr (HPr) family protein [Desulforadius tongensis]